MKTVELFCGTKSFSKIMAKYGHETFTTDNNWKHNPDLSMYIEVLKDTDLPKDIDILWASPPCTAFSVASIGTHWNQGEKFHTPKTIQAVEAQGYVKDTISIIKKTNPKWWFIENPRGMLRKIDFMQDLGVRKTVTYCQYGDTRMKPTDIWTNAEWWKPRPMCKNGAPCHVRAPRGARTGTQGIKGNIARGVIPPDLFEEILSQLNVVQPTLSDVK